MNESEGDRRVPVSVHECSSERVCVYEIAIAEMLSELIDIKHTHITAIPLKSNRNVFKERPRQRHHSN